MKLTKKSWLRLVLGGCFAWAAVAGTVRAQGANDDEVVRVASNLVVVNVTVTDANGKYVRGLKREDFQLFEDGKAQTPDTFSAFGGEATPFAAAILLDTSGSMETRMTLARAAAIRFLDGVGCGGSR